MDDTAGDSVLTVAGLADARQKATVAAEDVAAIRDGLRYDLDVLAGDWDRLSQAPLRVTKARIRSTALCPAQVLGELQPVPLDDALALGAVCDIAAGIVAVDPTFDGGGRWYGSIGESLRIERPDVVEFVDSLPPERQAEFETAVNDRCSGLASVLGYLPPHDPTVRERATVEFDSSGVALTAEIDLMAGEPLRRVLTEIKSGVWHPRLVTEIGHYSLAVALRDGTAPAVGCVVTLADQAVTALPIDRDHLQLAADNVVRTVRSLIDVDRAVAAGRPPRTSPGQHCRWCPRVRACPDVSDEVLADIEIDRGSDFREGDDGEV